MANGFGSARLLGTALAATIITTGVLALPATPAHAAACPTVDQSTGAVSPAPSPGVDWSLCDLSDANLSGADLASANLQQDSLQNANLSGATLDGVNLKLATLSGATVAGASMNGTVLAGAIVNQLQSGGITGAPASLPTDWKLIQGYLAGPTADLAGAALQGANAAGDNIAGTNLAGADLTGADLQGSNLESSGLTGATLSGADLAGANLYGADLSGVTAKKADFTGATLTAASLDSADLTGATLTSAALGGSFLTGATLTGVRSGGITGSPVTGPANWVLTGGGYLAGPGADFSGLTVILGSYQGALDLAGANLSNANLAQSGLDNANLAGADLAGATVTHLASADLTNADLTGADLTNADLTGAQLAGAALAGTVLTGSTLAGVSSGGITGTPASLPASWLLTVGYLAGPGAYLTGADLTNADLAGGDLLNAFLNQANLTGADLAGASLSDAMLDSANLANTNVAGTDFSNSALIAVASGGMTGTPSALPSGWTLAGGYLLGPEADLHGAALHGLNLSGLNLNSADASSADLSGANLGGSNLGGVNLSGANLAGTSLGTATLDGVLSGAVTGAPASLPAHWALRYGYLIGPMADLAGSSLHGADLHGADADHANLRGADLSGANLHGASLQSVVLEGSADLSGADLSGANLQQAAADSAKFTSANLTGASLRNADLNNADLTSANLTGADLTSATTSGATFTGAVWSATICPDGSSSDAHVAGCFSALDTAPPSAAPAITKGTAGSAGWYISPVTVAWHWSDDGALNPAACPATATTQSQGNPVTLTGSCADLAGQVAHAAYKVKVDTAAPAVSVTGVTAGGQYVLGKVPAARCKTTDSLSGVAASAAVTVTTTGSHGVGAFTATCRGAADVAGNQAAPVSVRYTVVYGFGGFISPKPKSTIAAHSIVVKFRLTKASGTPISATLAAALAAAHKVQAVLKGPGISPVPAACGWNATGLYFQCTIARPAGVKTGKAYSVTANENLVAGFTRAPAVGTAVNPETIFFK